MSDLLFLCHRIPYPPDKGEKIRAWNLLRGLAARHRVHLGAFVDDAVDWAGREALEQICAEVHLVWLNRRLGKLRSLAALPTRQSLSVAFYRDRRMQRWVGAKLAEGMDNVFVYSSTMAQYMPIRGEGAAPTGVDRTTGALSLPVGGESAQRPLAAGRVPAEESPLQAPPTGKEGVPLAVGGASRGDSPTGAPELSPKAGAKPLPAVGGTSRGDLRPLTITDFVDVDSEKWRQYGEAGGLMGWLYSLEGRRLAAFERERAHRADHTLLVTESERTCFLRSAPELAGRVHAVPNGVDTEYFSPEKCGENPFGGTHTLVFTGAMDYRPNVEAVLWFAREIFPRIREREPDTAFCVVGLRPTPAVEALAREAGISVTGRVPDVRPYVGHAAAVVAPLTIARGIQNKVLEAMAMAKTVVCTPQALEGIDVRHGEHLFVASDPKPFVEAVLALIQRPERAAELGANAMRYVREHHSWAASVAAVEALLARGNEPEIRGEGAAPKGFNRATEALNPPVGGAPSRRSPGSSRSCTAESGVRHPMADVETSHAASPRTTYGRDAAYPVGAVSDREMARSDVHPSVPGSARGALSWSETAPTGKGIRGEGAAPTGFDHATEAMNPPVGGAHSRRMSVRSRESRGRAAAPVGAQFCCANPHPTPSTTRRRSRS
ncbi:TIGR03087 family PEP-CTERM/XrtA system glycosyltransferase [Sediminicurvatus halobius]|nr:TIGR03087 family PEP-CTERM/XrtA system glycosyltransferase [Spiribacter halobius]UEX77354.1 TIGR03087 family PEP-CTERM/XrtA system glycosyltransferase [Spiribacter halobius]